MKSSCSSCGCCSWISGLWITRQLVSSVDKNIVVRTTLRELVIYLCFLVDLTVLALAMYSHDMYMFTSVMSSFFLESGTGDSDVTFTDVAHINNIWDYVEGPLIEALYWDQQFQTLLQSQADESASKRKPAKKVQLPVILHESRLLGVARIRQVRVRSGSCRVPDEMRPFIKQCYGHYSWLNELPPKTKFGGGQGPAWTYRSAEEVASENTWGSVSTYYGGGAYVDFDVSKNVTMDTVSKLRKLMWIDEATRAVFISFSLYNVNINLFCVVKLLFELPTTGGVLPSSSFHSIKLLRHHTRTDHVVLACQLVFSFFIIYYIIEEIMTLVRLKRSYFSSLWSCMGQMVLMLGVVSIALAAYQDLFVSRHLRSLLQDHTKYANFESLSFYQSVYNSTIALCLFFSWVKLFQYVSFNKTMTQLNDTLSRCSKDIAGFAILFFIVFFAFTQLGYLLFGTQVEEFSTFKRACFTLLLLILGDFDFSAIERAHRVLGPIYFLSYVFFVFFVLLNMFLAIINDTYSEVKTDDTQANQANLANFFRQGYNNFFGKCGGTSRLADIENALKLTLNDGQHTFLTIKQVRRYLAKCNFTDDEINLFLERYKPNVNKKNQSTSARASNVDELDESVGKNTTLDPNDMDKLHEVIFGEKTAEQVSDILQPRRPATARRVSFHLDRKNDEQDSDSSDE